jgi:hypothetical protein
MLAHALGSMRDGQNPHATALLTFLQSVLRNPEGLTALERAIPWTDLAAFLSQGHEYRRKAYKATSWSRKVSSWRTRRSAEWLGTGDSLSTGMTTTIN